MRDFEYVEVMVREALGISDSLIKKTRRAVLEAGVDFEPVGGRICYTADGVGKVVAYLKGDKTSVRTREKVEAACVTDLLSYAARGAVPAEKQAVSAEDSGGGADWTVPACELVFHKAPLNRRIVLGRIPVDWIEAHGCAFRERTGADPERPQRIQVKDSGNFTEQMVIPCRHVQADLWKCTRRMPRGRGRW